MPDARCPIGGPPLTALANVVNGSVISP